MPKYRVFELAKEFGATSKVILDILARNNIPVKNHMSSVDDSGKQIVEKTFARKVDTPTVAPAQERPPAQPIRTPVKEPAKPLQAPKPTAEQGKTKTDVPAPQVKKTYVAGPPQNQSAQTSQSGKDLYRPKQPDNRQQNQNYNKPAARAPYQQGQNQQRKPFVPNNNRL